MYSFANFLFVAFCFYFFYYIIQNKTINCELELNLYTKPAISKNRPPNIYVEMQPNSADAIESKSCVFPKEIVCLNFVWKFLAEDVS